MNGSDRKLAAEVLFCGEKANYSCIENNRLTTVYLQPAVITRV
uniref:Uncharacterized protein n=1 Tax=Utricularia reniformis TaxID=192314 RepID=A0A1Y0B1F1_9LAMI|nr:hypothetical protein AEK19_MT0970 [Utricularia reniformis]ART31193.1 hypothetical protein AEK19_MT0970 [Utricularia reniformis]